MVRLVTAQVAEVIIHVTVVYFVVASKPRCKMAPIPVLTRSHAVSCVAICHSIFGKSSFLIELAMTYAIITFSNVNCHCQVVVTYSYFPF